MIVDGGSGLALGGLSEGGPSQINGGVKPAEGVDVAQITALNDAIHQGLAGGVKARRPSHEAAICGTFLIRARDGVQPVAALAMAIQFEHRDRHAVGRNTAEKPPVVDPRPRRMLSSVPSLTDGFSQAWLARADPKILHAPTPTKHARPCPETEPRASTAACSCLVKRRGEG